RFTPKSGIPSPASSSSNPASIFARNTRRSIASSNVAHNNRKKAFEITTSGRVLQFPYSRVEPLPKAAGRIREVFVDKELGNEAFTYILESGKEGTVHIEQVLEYNQDPFVPTRRSSLQTDDRR